MKIARVRVSLLEPKLRAVFKMDVSIHQHLRSCYRASRPSQRQAPLMIALCSESGFQSNRFNSEMKNLGPGPWGTRACAGIARLGKRQAAACSNVSSLRTAHPSVFRHLPVTWSIHYDFMLHRPDLMLYRPLL